MTKVSTPQQVLLAAWANWRPHLLRHRPAAARAVLAVLAVLVAAGAGPARAIAVAGESGVANSGSVKERRLVPSTPAPGADVPTLELINGRIDAVDAEGRAITLRGKPVPLHPTRLRVVGPGGQALSGARALRPGMQVRFALDAEARAGRPGAAGASQTLAGADAVPAARAIVLIYIDSQP